MKKLGFLLIMMLALIFICAPALAVGTSGQGDMVARNGELAAFLDGNGSIYISGLNTPVNTTPAESVLTIDSYRILFLARANAASGIPGTRLISLNLDDNVETIVTDDAYAACLDAETVYYISSANRKQLMQIDLDTRFSAVAYQATEDLERVYPTANGVIVTLVEGAGAYIYDSVRGSFVSYSGEISAEIASFENFDLTLTDSRNLYVQPHGSLFPTQVDSSVQDWAVIGETVFYLSGSADNLTLKSYDVSNALWNVVLVPGSDIEAQLTASQNSLFMLSTSGTVYSVDVRNGRLVGFATLPSLSSYALGNGLSLSAYRIEDVSGQLNVYGVVEDANTLPTFTFVDYTSQIVADTSAGMRLLCAYSINGESTVWDLLQPAPQFSPLRRGSRGEAVAAIQQPLYDLGYYNYYIDGIFGWRTELAVKLLQADLNLPVTGIADEDLQRTILAGGLEPYDPYKTLRRGSSGWRVQQMQLRLRDLGYLADDADSIFGPRTEKAVALFQTENGLRSTGVADSDTLRRLFSDTANACSTYIDLQRGDSGYRVRELNQRLKDLYYLEGEVGSSYGSATVAAVKRFQQEVGLKQTGIATVAVQRELFARTAPEYSGYITLRRGDSNLRVRQMQQRLRDLGYYTGSIDSYFGKSTQTAVKKFQMAVGLPITGVADPETLSELFSPGAPIYREPEKLGTPVIELSAYSKYTDGIFYIADSVTTDGGITVSWFADGDVASYEVTIRDDRDNEYLYNFGLSPNIASIPLTSLDPDRTYTVSVTANPFDTADDSPTNATLRFVRVMEEPEPDPGEIGEIGKLIVTPEGEDIVRENGVYYIPGDTLSFKWSANGSVAGYNYLLTDADGNSLDGSDAADETQSLQIDADALSSDKVYTLTVYAIPTNGTVDDATVESIEFALRVVVDTTPLPSEDPIVPSSPDGTTEQIDASVDTTDPTDTTDTTDTADAAGTSDTADTADAADASDTTDTADAADTSDTTDTADTTGEPAESVAIGAPALDIQPNNGVTEGQITDADGIVQTVNVVLVGEGKLQLAWPADGDISGYDVTILNAAGQAMVSQTQMSGASATIDSVYLTPGEIYTLTVTAHAAADESVTSEATLYFALPGAEPEPVAVSEPDAAASEPDETSSEPDEMASEPDEPASEPDEPASEPDEPASEPDATASEPDEPASEPEPEPEPVNIGVPVLDIQPNQGLIEMEVDGYTAPVYQVGDGTIALSWMADGDVSGYNVCILDSNGNAMVDQNLTDTGASISSSYLIPGEIYTLNVTAYAAADSSVVSNAALYFTYVPAVDDAPAYDEPSYDEPTYDEPTYDEPSYDEPTYEEPTYEEPTYEEPSYEEPSYDEPSYDEPTYEEPSYEEPTYEEPTYDEPTYDEPTYDEPTYDEPTYEESTYDEPTYEDSPAWTTAITPYSDYEEIWMLQQRLVEWKWLSNGSYTEGVLDEATVQAVVDFQTLCAEYGIGLIPCDPMDPVVETDTLALLFNTNGEVYANPYA